MKYVFTLKLVLPTLTTLQFRNISDGQDTQQFRLDTFLMFFHLLQPLLPLTPSEFSQLLQLVSTGPRLDGHDQEDEVQQEADEEKQHDEVEVDLQYLVHMNRDGDGEWSNSSSNLNQRLYEAKP